MIDLRNFISGRFVDDFNKEVIHDVTKEYGVQRKLPLVPTGHDLIPNVGEKLRFGGLKETGVGEREAKRQ